MAVIKSLRYINFHTISDASLQSIQISLTLIVHVLKILIVKLISIITIVRNLVGLRVDLLQRLSNIMISDVHILIIHHCFLLRLTRQQGRLYKVRLRLVEKEVLVIVAQILILD